MRDAPDRPDVLGDPARLAALDGYAILDTPAEAGFDDLVLLAMTLCQAPVALVSLVTGDRQWFKARIGFPPSETGLDASICAHALGETTLLVIPDLTEDARTRRNPLVTGAPHLRFYAGAPLRTPDGAVLGTLCVIDHVPRPEGLTAAQATALLALANQVVTQLELRRAVLMRDALLQGQGRARRERDAVLGVQDAIARAGGNLDTILQALVTHALAAVTSAEGAVLELIEGEELCYRAVGGTLSRFQGLRLRLDNSLAGHCATTGRSLLCADVLDEPHTDATHVKRLNLRSAVLAPVSRDGKVVGVLKLQSSLSGAFDEQDLGLAELLAGEASAGLSSAAEAAARRMILEGELRYRAVFESAIDFAVIVLDLQGRVVDWNPGAAEVLGWTVDEMVGLPGHVIFTPEDRAAGVPEREMHSALHDGRGIDERWHMRKSGERFWANGEMMALRPPGGGEAVGFVKIMRDRTEQRQHVDRLEASQRDLHLERSLLEAILLQAPVGVSIVHADGRAMMNRRARALMGHDTPAEGLARYEQFFAPHPDGRDAGVEDDPTVRALLHGETVSAEPMLYRPAGDSMPRRWEVSSAPVMGPDGVRAAVSVFIDVEDQLRVHEALAAKEAYWRGLFEQLREGFILGRLVRDEAGRVVDWRYEEVNQAWSDLLGIPAADAVGRTVRAVFGDVEDARVHEFAQVVTTGQSITFTRQVGSLERWYEGRAHRTGPDTFVVLYLETTERVLADQARQASEQRKAAMIELGDRLRDIDSIDEMTRVAAALVGRTLRVTRATFGRLDAGVDHLDLDAGWTAPGVRSVAGRYRFTDYGDLQTELRRGEPLVIDDVLIDPRTAANPDATLALNIRSLINLPVRQGGRGVAVFIVHDDRPRAWSAEEIGFLRTVADRVEVGVARLQAEAQQRLLNRELSHRLKNTLAMVQAVVSQTLRNATDLQVARSVLTSRIVALSKAHDLLISAETESADVRAIVTGALESHDDGRFVVDGPAIQADARAALGLSLMLHELATNAAKYGALSVPDGLVSIHWQVEDVSPALLRFVWEERGGPPVSEPRRKGFGSRLIERGLAESLDGKVRLDYAPTGLVCTMTAPLAAFAPR